MGTLERITDWRLATADEAYVSASRVQDRLFDLWDEVSGPARELVESWLSLTIERELFSGDELSFLLNELEGLSTSVSS